MPISPDNSQGLSTAELDAEQARELPYVELAHAPLLTRVAVEATIAAVDAVDGVAHAIRRTPIQPSQE